MLSSTYGTTSGAIIIFFNNLFAVSNIKEIPVRKLLDEELHEVVHPPHKVLTTLNVNADWEEEKIDDSNDKESLVNNEDVPEQNNVN